MSEGILKSAVMSCRQFSTMLDTTRGGGLIQRLLRITSMNGWRFLSGGSPPGLGNQGQARRGGKGEGMSEIERATTYEGMAKIARDEGYDEIAAWFDQLARAERLQQAKAGQARITDEEARDDQG